MVKPEQIEHLVKMVFATYTSYAAKNEFETVCDLYYLMFENEDYEQILANLRNYIADSNNKYAPKPSHLLGGQVRNVVPSHKETMEYLDSLEPKEKPTREEILEMARKAGLNV